jgi:hypothetical protein
MSSKEMFLSTAATSATRKRVSNRSDVRISPGAVRSIVRKNSAFLVRSGQ